MGTWICYILHLGRSFTAGCSLESESEYFPLAIFNYKCHYSCDYIVEEAHQISIWNAVFFQTEFIGGHHPAPAYQLLFNADTANEQQLCFFSYAPE